ncbi:MAG: 50S ribosomal protein L18 [Lentisphaeria bacterium]|nr:50S ribosomal protein L18 [Lentisphaeria bacterium]
MAKLTKKEARVKRHRRVRKKISGTGSIPRMAVCCTSKHIYVQFIDDETGRTLAAASTLCDEFRQGGAKANVEGAGLLGKIAAGRAVAADIKTVVFDRGGFAFHGKVKAIADAAREAGLKF